MKLKMQGDNNTQAVIFNGGRGYRLAEKTKGEMPKGYLDFNGNPLISFQIKSIVSAGIKDISIVVSTVEDKERFNKYVSDDLLPKANYEVIVIEYKRENNYSSPYLYFKNPLFTSKIGNKNLLTLNSDNVFSSQDMYDLINEAEACSYKDSFITTFQKPAGRNPFLIQDGRVVEQISEMFVDDSDITGMTFYAKEHVNLLLIGLNAPEPHVHKAVKYLIEKQNTVRVKKLSFFVNMNTINEYNQVLEYISLNPNW